MRSTALALAALLVFGMLATPASADGGGQNVTPVHNLKFPTASAEGTDSDYLPYTYEREGGTVEERMVMVFGSINSGAFITDVTDGGAPEVLAFYHCSVGQGDIQLFQQGERTFFTFTHDTGYGAAPSTCQAWGQDEGKFSAGESEGTFIVDITDPYNPQTVEWVPFPLGSHNQTVHPSGNFLYNSNSSLIDNAVATPATRGAGIEVWEISNLGTDEPINHGVMSLPPRPGLGTDSHDITFNTEGTRAYSAALSQTVIINTEDPATPEIVSTFVDPAINVEHQSNPVTVNDPLLGEREFLIVEDEFAGAAGAEQACPSGGTHVYDITGDLELAPVKVGSWYIADVTNTNAAGGLTSCTAHVFDIHEEAQVMTMSFYGGGVRVIDLTGLVGLSLGEHGVGMQEIGYHYFEDSNSWSVKAPVIERGEDGSLDFYMYSNDINRGIDTYHFTSGGEAPTDTGRGEWFNGTEWLDLNGPVTLPADYTPYCLLRAGGDLVNQVTAPLGVGAI